VRKEPPADVEKELSMVASRRALLERGRGQEQQWEEVNKKLISSRRRSPSPCHRRWITGGKRER
jgi:hypothetical protein